MGLCDGRVAIVTGAGRGIGREHALSLAGQGAKVVVNDLGGNIDGTGGDLSPAEQVVDEIAGMGGEAIANGDDVSTWEGAAAPGQRRRRGASATCTSWSTTPASCATGCSTNMTEEEWDAVIKVHLKGTFGPARWAAAYWREQVKAGKRGRRPDHQHHVGVGHLRQRRARPTTARPRPASRPSPSSPPSSWAATA